MKCIICKKDLHKDEFNDEHVFPESIGGGFVLSNTVCEECNSRLGTKVDSSLVDNFLIILQRYILKIPNKDGIVPNVFGLGVNSEDPNHKILWNTDKAGNFIGLHNYPAISCEEKSDGSLELNISADESYGEDFILSQAKKRLDRLGKNISMEELKKLTQIEYHEGPVKVNYTKSVSPFEYHKAMVKIAYEMAYYWLGSQYLNDDVGEELRKFINDELSVEECLHNYSMRYHIWLIKDDTPDFEFVGTENSHYCLIYEENGAIYVYINVFNVFQGTICVSENSSSYPEFKNKCMILNYKEKTFKETSNLTIEGEE